MKKILVSACLLGCPCRYDGASKQDSRVIALMKDNILIPVCPEQAGGLATPRVPAEIKGDGVFTRDGADVTECYRAGAKTAVRLAVLYGVDCCILKARSPSCGSGSVYDGSFTGTLIPGDGVSAAALKEAGYRVLTEEEL